MSTGEIEIYYANPENDRFSCLRIRGTLPSKFREFYQELAREMNANKIGRFWEEHLHRCTPYRMRQLMGLGQDFYFCGTPRTCDGADDNLTLWNVLMILTRTSVAKSSAEYSKETMERVYTIQRKYTLKVFPDTEVTSSKNSLKIVWEDTKC